MTASNLPVYDSGTTFQRERKFLLDADAARSVWSTAAHHLRRDEWAPGASMLYVRTTYFDTPDLAYFRSSTTGSVATRLRVREYAYADDGGIPILSGDCFLEVKQSAGGLRAKSRVPIRPRELRSHLEQLSEAPLSACLTTWYRRSALTDDGERVRVTLDQRICFCRPQEIGDPCLSVEPRDVLAHGPEYVLEVKLLDEAPPWLSQALGGLHEAIGFSKFNTGMRAAVGEDLRRGVA